MVLRDDQWVRIEKLMQCKAGDRGRRGTDNRLFVEAVLCIARTGIPRRALPAEFGSWNSTMFDLLAGPATMSGTTSLRFCAKMLTLKKSSPTAPSFVLARTLQGRPKKGKQALGCFRETLT